MTPATPANATEADHAVDSVDKWLAPDRVTGASSREPHDRNTAYLCVGRLAGSSSRRTCSRRRYAVVSYLASGARWRADRSLLGSRVRTHHRAGDRAASGAARR